VENTPENERGNKIFMAGSIIQAKFAVPADKKKTGGRCRPPENVQLQAGGA
jgi:hypothetical protein